MTIINYITLFIIYSFLGWVMESFFRSICEKKLINTGFLYGVICPIYGIGAIIMLIFLDNLKQNVFILFISAFFILSLWEYIVGWLLEKIFNAKYWDYSKHKFNINGRICLANSIAWGILAVVFLKYIHPFILSKLNKIPEDIVYISTIIFSGIIVIDTIVTTIKVKSIEAQIDKLKQIGEKLKVKAEELKNTKTAEYANSIEKIQSKIDELKLQEEIIRTKVLKKAQRLKTIFPTMKSNAISNFLNEKKELVKDRMKK